jgi:hypothetical protein
MDIDVFPSHELPTVMRALRTALAPSGALDARERSFLDTYAHITGCAAPNADPVPIAAHDVVIVGAHPRKRLVQLAALAVLLARPVKPDSLAYLKALAGALATHDPVIDVLDALIRGRRRTVRLLAMRRGLRVMFKEAWLAEGPWGMLRLFGAMALRAAVNKDQLWHYKRLGLLPDGTLGREYWKHMTEVGFGFPGDVGGIAASVAYHDIAHVLAEHDTTPLGEIQQGSFQGGNRREDGFFFIQFVVLQFHQGIKITPGAPPAVGQFDPAKVLWAIHRGACCNVDMTHQWNYWPLMPLALEAARARVGLLPKTVEASAAAAQPALRSAA